ncbi:cytochrome b561 [Rhizocola hellebori]|uniref:Cytochrome b561 n=1 Tax=Rhizocola hellebori TaxID=1392758 RepID=A0A8J3VGF3_9ACTN|nr:COX15/CtaA family protein [Rhizocola hellebori]GIH05082.1 cytochrome b561 [Rhizocola hellebori]
MLVRSLTLANLIANVAIVITGGAVRLTGSGMACPTWPECVEGSYVPTSAAPQNVGIEFGNRLLSIIVGMIAVGTVLALWRRPQRALALWVLGGVLFQGLLGGLTVRFHLSPYFVGPHFLISMALIAVAYRLWRQTNPSFAPAEPRLRPLAWALTAASALVVLIGVVVTGSGPHSGDAEAVRTGLDPEMISQLHVDAVFLLFGLTIAMWFAARAVKAPSVARATFVLFGVSLAQGAIGFVQYFTGLPWVLVGFHLAGACAVWLATLGVHRTTAAPGALPSASQADPAREMVTV